MRQEDVYSAVEIAASHAAKSDAEGRLFEETIEAIRYAGFARHFVPERWRGEQGTFGQCAQATVLLGEVDASAAWFASVAASMGRTAAYLPPEGQADVWAGGPDSLLCGTLAPAGEAVPTTEGWLVRGRWSFVTGAHSADWALLSGSNQDQNGERELRIFLIPRSAYSVEETWRSPGMRATRSDTIVLHDYTLVPSHHSFSRQAFLRGAPIAAADAIYAVPHIAMTGLLFASPLLGAARGMFSQWSSSRRATPDVPDRGELRDLILATASSEIEAAELMLARAAARLDRKPLDGLKPASNRCYYPFVADLIVSSVNRLFRAAGSRGIASGELFERSWRDVNSAAVHPALQHEPGALEYAAHAESQPDPHDHEDHS